jgi:putative tricarboxylic transport membrane protein
MRAPKDLVCGLLLAGFGAVYFWLAHDYGMGSAARMGPGYFPRALGALLVVLGVLLAARSLVIDGAPFESFSMRPFLVLSAAIMIFGLLLRPLGLVIAVIILVVVGSLAGRSFRWGQVALLAVVLATFSTLAFPIGLGLPIPVWPRF